MQKTISLIFFIQLFYGSSSLLFSIAENPALSNDSVYKEAKFSQRDKDKSPSIWFSLKQELPQGVWHIFTGLDHIAFVVALALILYRIKTLVQVVTFFTIAHALTLTLYSLNIISIGKLGIAITEILVAISIAWVGIENLLLAKTITGTEQLSSKFRWRRSWIAFGFGLVHGIAFSEHFRNTLASYDANSLKDLLKLLLTILFFNIGVDVGQLFFVLLTFFVLYYIREKFEPHEIGVSIHGKLVFFASIAIASLGSMWTFERVYLTFLR